MTITYSGLPLSFNFDDVDPVPLYAQASENRGLPENETRGPRRITVVELMDLVFESLKDMRPARDLINAALGRWYDENVAPHR
jgi:hypothetical protein